jgi:hypothetical protein
LGNTTTTSRIGFLVACGILTVVLSGVLIALLLFGFDDPPTDSIEFEIAKSCLQLINIVIIGGLWAAAFEQYQHARGSRLDEKRREDEFLPSSWDRNQLAVKASLQITRKGKMEVRLLNPYS